MAQDLYRKDRAHLAEKIITGSPIAAVDIYPSIQEVEKFYSDIYERHSKSDPGPPSDPKESESVYTFIHQEEILGAIRTWSNSGPGPDGITITQVKRCPAILLEVRFNIILYRRMTPSAWRASRTILIPKEGSRADPSNWRPITIGSATQRLLHRILAKRLQATLPIHPTQRGFRSIDGTLANTIVLDHYIKSRRLKGKTYNVVSLDVRKAFDMVSHAAIFRALERLGVDQGMRDYLRSTHTNCHTNIQWGIS